MNKDKSLLLKWEVYETTNITNGKTYIGQHRHTSSCMGPKLNRVCKYKGSGVAILKAIRKHGKENFEKKVLALADTQEEADSLERELILSGKSDGRCQYNLYDGHRVSSPAINRNNSYREVPYRHSEETRAKMSEASKEKWGDEEARASMLKNHNFTVSDALRQAAREATLKVWSDEKLAKERKLAIRRGNFKRNHLKGLHEKEARNLKAQKDREKYCPLCLES